jgi:hypothetical protein
MNQIDAFEGTNQALVSPTWTPDAAGALGLDDAMTWVIDLLQDVRHSIGPCRKGTQTSTMTRALSDGLDPTWLECLGEHVPESVRQSYILGWTLVLERELQAMRTMLAVHIVRVTL